MASVNKLSRDKRKKNAPYYIQFKDHEGKRRTTKGCSDRGVSQAKAAQIETLVEKIKMGVAKETDLEVMLGRKQADGLEPYLKRFENSLRRKENTEKHVKLTLSRIRLVIEGCKFQSLDDLDADAAEVFLTDFCKKADIGHRTYNHYLQAIDSFGNWLAHPKRRIIDYNPFAGIERRNAETDVRHKRRALSADEIGKIVKIARESQYSVQRFDGETRARIYLLSYMTGLRKGELASLTPQNFDLDATQPTVTVEASVSKHRKKDVLPLHAELVEMVRGWISGMPPNEPLFPKLAQRKAYKMIQRDLKEAEIPYETEEGIADFHAAGRHTHITGLLKSGVKLVEAKELARHSDVRMTMKYTHIGLDDQAKAVNQLPGVEIPSNDTPNKCLHIVCNSSGADRQTRTSHDADRHDPTPKEKRRNSLHNKENGVDWQPVSHHVNNRQKVEAAGIEPACRDHSTQASTCIVR